MHKDSLDAVLGRMMGFFGVTTDSALSRALSVNRQTLAGWRKRDSVPYGECIKFCEMHGISLDWLLTGGGQMLRSEVGHASPASTENPREQALLALWRELDDDSQREIQLAAEEKKRLKTLEQRLQELEAVVASGKKQA
ncbi:phage repressor protein [Pseudomonas proteolytica]|uniref:Phage repressor protein n=1 Tax=Pseudomonas proteolytica TaxID=219574 RepID=A0AAW4ZWM9_9PSED|nr:MULTISPECIES: helix-turn-helix domain-containing protein [Pseudomonas]MBT9301621.1 helix-turn-helix domain containing protein [Pseudomonas sp. TAE6080]MCF5056919.1 phage repressor protein [Pseudomonas proteolytica]MCF5100601.1 phage repressor protein [Pseudomonas proteolytica]NNA67359.1 bacteriophage CI repressor [Pseudomonas gessardii]